MTMIGEQYWRLHVECEALPLDKNYKTNLEKLQSRMKEMYTTLPDADKKEVTERLKIAKGGY